MPEAAVYLMNDGDLLFTFDDASENSDLAEKLFPDDPESVRQLRRAVAFTATTDRAAVTDEWLNLTEISWMMPLGLLHDAWHRATDALDV